MVAAAVRSFALILFGVMLAMTVLRHAEHTPRLPLIHAGLSVCSPVGPQRDDGAPDAPEGPATPEHGLNGPERPNVA